MSGKRHEPRKRYYNRKRITFDNLSDTSCSDDEPPVKCARRVPVPVHDSNGGWIANNEPVPGPSHESPAANLDPVNGLAVVHEEGDLDMDVVAPLPAPLRERAEGFSMPPLPTCPDSDEYSGHCSDGVRVHVHTCIN